MPLFGRIKEKPAKSVRRSAIICAAGSSTRMGQDKLMLSISDKPVIQWTIEAFEECDRIDEIVIVTRTDLLSQLANLCKNSGYTKVSNIVVGGEQRLDSVLAGLAVISPAAEVVAVHDGARPLVTQKIIKSAVLHAEKYGSAVPAILPKDTVKEESDGKVHTTHDRSRLRLVQTPQAFQRNILSAALTNAKSKELTVTDDAQAVEALGLPVFFTDGSDENIKLTTPVDVLLAQAIMDRRNGQCE
ncbi:MAG: 2-C-methyl-D-erythritol 4-phosphate cytidylyltransferase [Ruminococcaceae bacterium]|nr:2-C-methyl-D-erythritol 4-phosphate cytidylyltransferase [Oscillospiraceae bacterium]